MNNYTIKVPKKRYQSHPKIEALKGVQIGPIFPEDPTRELGMRHLDQPKGHSVDWMAYRQKRRERNKVAAHSRARNRIGR